MAEAAAVPDVPNVVLGTTGLQGNIVTLLDDHRRFGEGSGIPGGFVRNMVVEAQSQVIGAVVDSVAGILEIQDTVIEEAFSVGGQEKSRSIHGLFSGKNELLSPDEVDKPLAQRAGVSSRGGRPERGARPSMGDLPPTGGWGVPAAHIGRRQGVQ